MHRRHDLGGLREAMVCIRWGVHRGAGPVRIVQSVFIEAWRMMAGDRVRGVARFVAVLASFHPRRFALCLTDFGTGDGGFARPPVEEGLDAPPEQEESEEHQNEERPECAAYHEADIRSGCV